MMLAMIHDVLVIDRMSATLRLTMSVGHLIFLCDGLFYIWWRVLLNNVVMDTLREHYDLYLHMTWLLTEHIELLESRYKLYRPESDEVSMCVWYYLQSKDAAKNREKDKLRPEEIKILEKLGQKLIKRQRCEHLANCYRELWRRANTNGNSRLRRRGRRPVT